MQMYLDPDDKKIMITSHLGKSLRWNVSTYNRIDMEGYTDNFREINRFLNTRTDVQQQYIFDVLGEIRELFDEIMPFNVLQGELTELVTKLYAYITLDELVFYINYKATISYPTDLKESYGLSDVNRSRTYLKHEYQGLVLIVLALRIMVPIWGEYMNTNDGRVGSQFKHYRALHIMYNTPLMNSPQMMRLREYVDTNIVGSKDRSNAVLAGISTEELPEYILADLLVRGISTKSLDATPQGSSIITQVYAHVKRSVRDVVRRFHPTEEKFRGGDNEREDRSSQLEQYKKTQSVSIGDIEMHKLSLTQYEDLLLQIDPTMDLAKLTECQVAIKTRPRLAIEKHNSLLVQWVVAGAGGSLPNGEEEMINEPRCVPELNYLEMLGLIAATQALLWHWGFLDLALIVTSSIDREQMAMATGSRTQASRSTMNILNEIYPYQQTNKSPSNNKNLAHLAVDEYEKHLRNRYLKPKVPRGLKDHFESTKTTHGWLCPNDILTQLTNLLAHIHHTLKEKI